MTIGIDGMVSGLDTGAIIDQLVAIQRNQQVLLNRKSSAASALVTALQALNTRVASLATVATKAAEASSWQVTKPSSSAESVAVSASPSAKPGTVELAVTQLASGQVSMLDDAALPTLAETFTITAGGQAYEISPASGHIDDVAAAINDRRGETGISATKVRTGTDEDGNAVHGLQLTGTTGKANAFSVHAGTDTSGTALASAATAVVPAQDAEITLWPSSGSGYQLTSATNTFDDVLEGVTITVSQQTADPVTVTVGTDAGAQRALVADLVGNLSVVLSEIDSRTRTTTSTAENGNTVVSGGPFSGDSAIRFLRSDLQAAMTNPAGGASPSAIGISIDRSGAISLDEAAFTRALADDPEGTMALVQSIAGRVAEVAEVASSSTDGTLTRKITSQESIVKDFGSQIARWDERLELRKSQLVAQFTAMEVRLLQLEGTQGWLTNQIAAMNASRENR